MLPIIGSETIRSGELTRGQLRWRYTALYPDIYVPKDSRVDLYTRALGAWLWSGRTGIIAGPCAASLHTPFPRNESASIEMIAEHRRTPPGLTIRQERISDDEVSRLGELPLTSPARTALDLGRRLPRDDAVILLDQLAAATAVTRAEVFALAERHQGTRGICQAWDAIGLMDGGAASPRETRLRLALADVGLPRGQAGIDIGDEWTGTVITLGWPEVKVGVGFVDNDTGPAVAMRRMRHQDAVQFNGWIEVLIDDRYQPVRVRYRVREAMRLQRVARHRA